MLHIRLDLAHLHLNNAMDRLIFDIGEVQGCAKQLEDPRSTAEPRAEAGKAAGRTRARAAGAAARYGMRPDGLGWTLCEHGSGRTLVMNGVVQAGLDHDVARVIAEFLNAHGDQSVVLALTA
ncbi:hypothetical protein M446_0252 [Methylobacterium sp. 4-46]|nr:hypothetical protein M446_0252 [Methylobacterium sp. 4-46]